ncbi:MAG: hypothetical protein H7840_08615 [Alphaproteobacteria bacterium]
MTIMDISTTLSTMNGASQSRTGLLAIKLAHKAEQGVVSLVAQAAEQAGPRPAPRPTGQKGSMVDVTV